MSASAVHTNGLRFSLFWFRYSWIAFSRLGTLSNDPRRIRFSVISANHRSTWFTHDPLVGVKRDRLFHLGIRDFARCARPRFIGQSFHSLRPVSFPPLSDRRAGHPKFLAIS
jgi:hypothetical protein